MKTVEPLDFTLIATDGEGRSMPVIIGTGAQTWDELPDHITKVRKHAPAAPPARASGAQGPHYLIQNPSRRTP